MRTWQLSFAGTLSRQDQQYLHELRRNLEGITPNDHDINMALWIREGSEFTVKSHYKFMQQGPHIKSELHKLWKIGAPPRVIVFSWLLLRNAILTIDNLRKRRWKMPSICSMCYQEEETVAHLFTECSFIKQLRKYIHDDVKPCTVYSLNFKQGDIFSMIVDTEDIK
jgi:zinc-binding in reverse transcriptase